MDGVVVHAGENFVVEEIYADAYLLDFFLRGGFYVPRADGFDFSLDDFWSGGEEETEGFAVRAVVRGRSRFLFQSDWFVFLLAVGEAKFFEFGDFTRTLLPSSEEFAIGI